MNQGSTEETKKVKDLVENNFIESFNESSNVVSDKNLNRDMNVEGFQYHLQ